MGQCSNSVSLKKQAMEMTTNFYNIDVENQFDLLLEVLNGSEAPLDLSIQKEEPLTLAPVFVQSSIPSFYSDMSSPASDCSSNSNDSILDFDESFLPFQVSSTGSSNSAMESDQQLSFLNVQLNGWSQPQFSSSQDQVQERVKPVMMGRKGVCTNCGTQKTSTWRKDGEGKPLCNACGLYLRIHKVQRPAEWGRTGAIMRRQRKPTVKRQQRT